MATDVVDLITSDHRELERLFEIAQNEPEKRPLVVPVIIALLTAHSRAEEAEVYPAAASSGIGDVEHSQKEHLEADQLAAAVAATDWDSPDLDRRLKDLVDAVKHHIEEEESSVLPEMRSQLDGQRLQELGQAFATSRGSHLGEMPDDITKAELDLQAANAGISGATSMGKAALTKKLKAAAEE